MHWRIFTEQHHQIEMRFHRHFWASMKGSKRSERRTQTDEKSERCLRGFRCYERKLCLTFGRCFMSGHWAPQRVNAPACTRSCVVPALPVQLSEFGATRSFVMGGGYPEDPVRVPVWKQGSETRDGMVFGTQSYSGSKSGALRGVYNLTPIHTAFYPQLVIYPSRTPF